MDLGSRWSYESLTESQMVRVNGKEFTVEHVEVDRVTGLDAYTFRNVATGELTIGFQGTHDGLDVLTDALLVTSLTPAQYAAADHYVEMIERDVGPVSSVCGNSLGGGLAGYVATTRPHLLAVTVNPAPVPWDSSRGPVRNVTNYVTETDLLSRVLRAGGLDHRVVGRSIPIAGTSFHLDHLLANHIGSDRGDPALKPYDASMSVPFSLFHADQVLSAGSLGAKVDIDVGNLDLMTAGLRHQRDELLGVLAVELTGVEEALRQYAVDLPQRGEQMGRTLADALDDAYRPVRSAARAVEDLLSTALLDPLISLPTPPGAVALLWRPLLAQAVSSVNSVRAAVQDLVALSARETARVAWRAAWDAMLPESRDLTQSLITGGGRIRKDVSLMDRKWTAFAKSADAVARFVEQADESTAAAIAGRRAPQVTLTVRAAPPPTGTVAPLPDDRVRRFHQAVVDARQTAAGLAVSSVARHVVSTCNPLSDLCGGAIMSLATADQVLAAGTRQVRVAAELASVTGPGQVLTVATGDGLRTFAASVETVSQAFSRDVAELCGELVRLKGALDRLPDLVNHLQPYLTETFFSDAMIEAAYDSFLKCRNLVRRSETAFDEIRFQLEDHEAGMIHALARRAENLRRDLATTSESLTAMVS